MSSQEQRKRWRDYRRSPAGKTATKKYRNSITGREKIKEYNRRRNQARRISCLIAYSGTEPHCACCGEKHLEFLAIDHINGGGNKHRRDNKLSSGDHFFRWLQQNNYPEGFQVLCHNCNQAKGYYGKCPHQNI